MCQKELETDEEDDPWTSVERLEGVNFATCNNLVEGCKYEVIAR